MPLEICEIPAEIRILGTILSTRTWRRNEWSIRKQAAREYLTFKPALSLWPKKSGLLKTCKSHSHFHSSPFPIFKQLALYRNCQSETEAWSYFPEKPTQKLERFLHTKPNSSLLNLKSVIRNIRICQLTVTNLKSHQNHDWFSSVQAFHSDTVHPIQPPFGFAGLFITEKPINKWNCRTARRFRVIRSILIEDIDTSIKFPRSQQSMYLISTIVPLSQLQKLPINPNERFPENWG